MKKLINKCSKAILYVITNAAFLFILTNVNTTCCGPGYQPVLPKQSEQLKRYKND